MYADPIAEPTATVETVVGSPITPAFFLGQGVEGGHDRQDRQNRSSSGTLGFSDELIIRGPGLGGWLAPLLDFLVE